ncbi:hypothetical protein C2E23DRAFT_617226 [Lenzites betulinus]|nr:hypothetical protein C2E23DRAFT_617226 [Lenzites betulinus]
MTRNRSSVYHGRFKCVTTHGSTRSAESTLQGCKHLWPGVAGRAPEMMRCVLDDMYPGHDVTEKSKNIQLR